MKILVLKENHMNQVFTMKEAIKAAKDSLISYSSNDAEIPLRTNINVKEAGGQSLYMPGYAASSKALGIKIVSVIPNNINKGLPSVPATMILLDEETGQVCAMMDGTYLTRVRTGAVSGAATELLSNEDSSIFAIFGTGGQAETQVEAVLAVRNIKELRIYDINIERAKDFAAKMMEKFNIKCIAVESSEEAIENADIITSVTTTKNPVFDGRLVKKGAHINGVGSYTPEMHEIDEYTVLNAGKVYVDTRDGVLSESADLINPIKNNKCTESIVTGELGELLLGKTKGRESSDEITFFKTVGTAVLDIVTAKMIYIKALELNIGDQVEM
ncbi:Ornithine cyclodeaminase family protein [Acetoanaerobium sticklandii]|uniref:Ornithine cyclodeaminase family protein n=1 Tax=Acetoanaerobium sticklandii (strain ATCC 12662 / DSM 519 / JCM 1433 / CCUG 9281 / NCIMB 10654 / HF) TaxID=499177 RepID=E3PS69_ACESD|nr:ornithine cyclodeaminase family protein [Acetoanaerobium sticklandii]CBH21723.1 Ornithine cyclodeaminase family protein [Acetoanaerobium sticklandii]